MPRTGRTKQIDATKTIAATCLRWSRIVHGRAFLMAVAASGDADAARKLRNLDQVIYDHIQSGNIGVLDTWIELSYFGFSQHFGVVVTARGLLQAWMRAGQDLDRFLEHDRWDLEQTAFELGVPEHLIIAALLSEETATDLLGRRRVSKLIAHEWLARLGLPSRRQEIRDTGRWLRVRGLDHLRGGPKRRPSRSSRTGAKRGTSK